MKTKFIFAFVALLMLGSATLKAQEESKGSNLTDYSNQPFTIVPIEKDLTIVIMGDDDCGAFDSVEMYWSYDQGETWNNALRDMASFDVSVGQKISFMIEGHHGNGSSGIYVENKNYEEEPDGRWEYKSYSLHYLYCYVRTW